MIRKDLNTPLWQLTLGEFLDMVDGLNKEPQPVTFSEDKYVYGIAGIAKLLGCSKPTAQKIKDSGVISKAISQTGRKIVVNAALALELLSQSKK